MARKQQCALYDLLGLAENTPASPRWQFYREGYLTQIAADEMTSFYEAGEQ